MHIMMKKQGTGVPVTRGSALYETPGLRSWTCPEGVTSVSVVCVGGGGAGHNMHDGCGGAGGGLGWKNNIPVIPGNVYWVKVGAGGGSHPYITGSSAPSGETSYFADNGIVRGEGGTGGNDTNPANSTYGSEPTGLSIVAGGGYYGDGGGNGGYSWHNIGCRTGGGGAGGYSGNGGHAGMWYGDINHIPVQAGAGGGGAGGVGVNNFWASSGGGVGVYGEGTSGNVSTSNTYSTTPLAPYGGGSGGDNGTVDSTYPTAGDAIPNGKYGGGGYGNQGGDSYSYGAGGNGAVRIVWGAGRSFPSTDVDTAENEVVI